MREIRKPSERITRAEQDRQVLERRSAICECLRYCPGFTTSEMREFLGPKYEWAGDEGGYGRIYHVLRQLVKDGMVVEEPGGPKYRLAPMEHVRAQVISDFLDQLDTMLPDWGGVGEFRARVREMGLGQLSQLVVLSPEMLQRENSLGIVKTFSLIQT